ncbi:MAG: hypothetical protein CMH83_09175 [Nocardioides sp.]|nr:hypothetical protein [Nocardioides sp.]
METVRLLLLVVHVLGFSALIGGLLVQIGSPAKEVNGAMRDGIGTAFVAGLLLVGVLEGLDVDINYAKIAVKTVIGLVLLVLVMANVRKPQIPQGLWAGMTALAVINVCVAILWSSAHAA